MPTNSACGASRDIDSTEAPGCLHGQLRATAAHALAHAPLLRQALTEADRSTALLELQEICRLLLECARVEELVFRSARDATRQLRTTFGTLMPCLSDAEAQFPDLVDHLVAELAALDKVARAGDCANETGSTVPRTCP